MKSFLIVFSFLCLVVLVSSQLDHTVCTPATAANNKLGPPKPSLPKTYTSRVECNIINKNKTTDVIEYFDQPNNQGAVFQTDGNITAQLLYSFKTNELFTIYDGACNVDPLASDDNNFLFGFKSVNSSLDRIYTANGALRFGGDINEKYMGKTSIRGMLVNSWQSCTYWPELKATSSVMWYFTDNVTWVEATGDVPLPVRCAITGKSAKGAYHHVYDFSHFRSYVDTTDEVFETPVGIYCKGRKQTKPLPPAASYFEFESEVIIPEAKIISHQKQYYDSTTKLFRYDWTPLNGLSDSKYGNHPLTAIHDYNTGVAYISDNLLGNCSTAPISAIEVDAVANGDGTVRMRTPAEFFDFNEGTFEYEGVHSGGAVSSDVWISSRSDWPAGAAVPSTWEWYFATNDWVESSGNLYEAGEPRRLEVRVQNEVYAVYNVFAYRESEPVLWDYDISACFNSGHKRHFQFELPGSFKALVIVDEETFKYSVLLSIIGYTAISPLRVHDIQVDYDETSIRVTFTMLDIAPIAGSVAPGVIETPLDAAAGIFTQSVQDGKFVVDMQATSVTNPVHLTARIDSAKELDIREYLNNPIPPPPSGYHPGSMAAVGVIMAIIGFAIGGGVMFFIYKRNGGSFSKSEAPQSFENPAAEKS